MEEVTVVWAHAWPRCAVAALLKKVAKLAQTVLVCFGYPMKKIRKTNFIHRLRRGMLLNDRSSLYFILVYCGKQLGSSRGQIVDAGSGGYIG